MILAYFIHKTWFTSSPPQSTMTTSLFGLSLPSVGFFSTFSKHLKEQFWTKTHRSHYIHPFHNFPEDHVPAIKPGGLFHLIINPGWDGISEHKYRKHSKVQNKKARIKVDLPWWRTATHWCPSQHWPWRASQRRSAAAWSSHRRTWGEKKIQETIRN